MIFVKFAYAPLIIFIFLVFAFLFLKKESQFFSWIKRYWDFNRTTFSKVSSYLFLLGMFFY